MISTAGINDQELAVIAEISSINDPSVTRRTDLRIGARRGLDLALHAVHEILNRLDLLRERLDAAALALQRFFVFALPALAFVDEGGNAAAVLRQHRAIFDQRIPFDGDIAP